MTSKQRAYLRALASKQEAIFQIGKANLTDELFAALDEALEKRELIKISVLKACDFSAKELVDELAKRLRAEPVTVIGNKIVLYRYSHTDGIKHIEF